MTRGADTTSNLEPIGPALKELRYRLIKERGINADDLPTKEELDKRTAVMAQKALVREKQEFYSSQSLWPADIPVSFKFSDWKPDMQNDSKLAREIGKQAYVLTKRLIAGQKLNIAFVGAPGVGKTSLALAVLNELKTQNKGTMFVSTAELARLYQQKREFPDILKRLSKVEIGMKHVDVLLLDDLGTEGFSSFKDYGVRTDMQSLMYRISNARFDFENNRPGKVTLITTNNTQEELKKMYDPKIISRLVPDKQEFRVIFNGFKDVRGV